MKDFITARDWLLHTRSFTLEQKGLYIEALAILNANPTWAVEEALEATGIDKRVLRRLANADLLARLSDARKGVQHG